MSDDVDEIQIIVEPIELEIVVGDRVLVEESGPATELIETGGPTTLAIGAVADGEYLRRSGSTIVGATASGGGNSYNPSGW